MVTLQNRNDKNKCFITDELMNNYQILGVDYEADERTIKRAYAKLIKEFRPDSHPVEFAKIRKAYEVLLDDCRYRREWQHNFNEDVSNDTEEQPTIQHQDNEQADNEIILVDKPTIELPLETASVNENQETNYERIVDKPIIAPLDILPELEPHKEDSFNRLIDKPVLRDTVVEPLITEEEQAWLQQPKIDVYALIKELQGFVMPKDEYAALACFQQQMNSLISMNLDQLMDYEERLYNYLIYQNKPALLLFAAANQYFDWQNKVLWLKSAQSQWHQQRFKALVELAVLYQQASDSYNPYFQVEHLKPKRLTTHYHLELKQQQREQWFIACHAGKLDELHGYFSEKALHQPIFLTDVLLGVIIGCFTGLIALDTLNEEAPVTLWCEYLPILVFSANIIIVSILTCGVLLVSRHLAINISKKIVWTTGIAIFILAVSNPNKILSLLLLGVFLFGVIVFGIHHILVNTERVTTKLIVAIFNHNWFKYTAHQQPLIYHTQPEHMNRPLYFLLFAQFLSAFADNAILFTVIAMVMKTGEQQGWYIPALQSAFLVAYVVLAPWVGHLADVHAKARVLMYANVIKAVGAALLLFHIEPLLAYGIVGVGAAIYSPAKYGILPELVGHNELVKANSWIEGSTIMAILLGMKIGAMVADQSVIIALIMTLSLFVISAVVTLALPSNISRNDNQENLLIAFGKQMGLFFTTPRSRFAVLGGSLFWAAAASLRVMLIAWASLVLASKNANEIADLTLYLTIGIIAGSIAVPRLIPLEHLRRARIPAYLMAIAIMGLSFTTHVLSAQIVLFFVGMMGGMFVVPINAVLQEHGQQTIGSGSAVALQNFFQNLAMLLSVGAYSIAAAQHINPIMTMFSLGGFVFIATLLVALNLPKDNA